MCKNKDGSMVETTNGIKIQLKHVTDIRDGARKETIAFEAEGLYYAKGNVAYLTFEESRETRTVKTVVKIAPDEVVVLRSGAVQMRHAFRKQAETESYYRTPFGAWPMKTKTEQIEYVYSDKTKKGRLFLSYILEMDKQPVGRHAVTITFREESA
jgi:uncharacterized beta-barrel protein YwiB (DUF1934 family)